MYNGRVMTAAAETRTLEIPVEVLAVVAKLAAAGFEAYAVGGCVRDLILSQIEGRRIKPEDWDVATNATPEQIREIFPESFYENKFFTVTVKTDAEEPTLREIEVTTFRAEGRYGDKRHPEDVRPAQSLEEDLSRRDFTVNALALSEVEGMASKIIDPYGGQKDLEAKLIRAVGNPERRFEEDALRMLRAVRIAVQLGFSIEEKSAAAIRANAGWLAAISKERIRDEFSKIIMADGGTPALPRDARYPKTYATSTDAPREHHGPGSEAFERVGAGRAPHQIPKGVLKKDGGIPAETPAAHMDSKVELLQRIGAGQAWRGLELLRELGLLKHILPELEEGFGCTQNKHHVYTVWEHNMRALDYGAKEGFPMAVRLAALLHDVGKPRAKHGEGPDSTFYGHDVIGAKMTYQLLSRLRYPEGFVERVAKLVRWHLFRYDYDVDEIQTTDAAIRRLIRNVGTEAIEDLVKVRMCDRIGSGVPKAVPYRLRHFQFRVEKVLREHEAVKVTMLQVRGDDVMKILGITPGPKVGHVLNALLEEVLDDPAKNERGYLESRIKNLGVLSDDELIKLREQAEARVELLEDQREKEIKKKYYVK